MSTINYEICEIDGCNNKATYAKFYRKPKRCINHKEDFKKQTKVCNCGSSVPSFNYEGLKPEFCKKCPGYKNEMIGINEKRCKCGNKKPSFNYEGLKPEFCKDCSEYNPDMVNTRSKLCECGKAQPTFNYKGLKPLYCINCPEYKEDMINVKSRMCKCGKTIPGFNYKGERAEYCTKCPEYNNDMVYVINRKRCNCGKDEAKYNYGNLKAKYCKNCPGYKADMVNFNNKLCKCRSGRALYNYENLKPLYCKNCPEYKNEMINVSSKKCICCKAQPSFNYKGLSPKYCKNCPDYKDDMINVVTRCRGQEGNCLQQGSIKYNYYCTTCFQHEFPNDPLVKEIRQKTKEIKVRLFINENFEGFEHDKSIWTGNCDCTHRRRIDHRKLIGNTLLCIETDEFQHKRYDEKDEEIRYNDLYMIHSGKWIFIRFNPDSYRDRNGKHKNPPLQKRFKILKNEIIKQISRIEKEDNVELVEIIKLFYNSK
jgi:hypothetical protein